MRLYQIFEARRNPHLNPKSDFVSELYYMMHKYRDNLFVSFTHLNKIGVNPQSKFNTPLGVYAYPASYVQKVLEERRYDVRNLPFAGDRPYVQFLESRGKGLDFDHYSYHDLEKDLGALFHFTYDVKMSHESFKEIVKIPEIKEVSKFNEQTPATILWTLTYLYSSLDNMRNMDAQRIMFVIEQELKHDKYSDKGKKWKSNFLLKKPLVNWNTFLNKVMGYDYVVDFGHGIIHQSEPSQVVFLTNRGYKHVGMFELGQEGAEKTVDKYADIESKIFHDAMNSIKKDFPKVNKNTKLIVPGDLSNGYTIKEEIERWINNLSSDDPDEVIDEMVGEIKSALLVMEFVERDFNENLDIYEENMVDEDEIYSKFEKFMLQYAGRANLKIKDFNYVSEIEKGEDVIKGDVHRYFGREFNIEEWE